VRRLSEREGGEAGLTDGGYSSSKREVGRMIEISSGQRVMDRNCSWSAPAMPCTSLAGMACVGASWMTESRVGRNESWRAGLDRSRGAMAVEVRVEKRAR